MNNPRWTLAILAVGTAALVLLAGDVRADAPPGHFIDLADGTVRDSLTGLVWQQGFSPSTLTQAASISYCTSLTIVGGGWRLPTVAELQTLVDETRLSPAVDPSFFPGTPSTTFWSGSPFVGSPANGWTVLFNDGDTHDIVATNLCLARCVR